MKKNLHIVAALLASLCFALAQDDSQSTPKSPPPLAPAQTAPTASTPLPAPAAPPAFDPNTGLPILVDPKTGRPRAQQIDPNTGLPLPATPPKADPLANGAFEEEGNLNLEAAMNSYQSVISRFDGERPEAANAIFRLGECYRNLGRNEEAKVQYARILREFPDQVELTKLSQKYLSEPIKGPARFQQRLQAIVRRAPNQTADSAGVRYSPNAKGYLTVQNLNASQASNPLAQEKELIQQQIKLVEKKLAKLGEMREQALVSDESIDDVKMQLLSLQRELAAWEAKNTVRKIVPPAATSKSEADLSTSPPTPAARPTIDSKKESLEPTLDELRSAALAAKQQLDDLDTLMKTVPLCQPEALPKEAANDPRYQEIKHEYEISFGIQTDLSKQRVEAARNKMRIWVNSIYLPELAAQLQFLHSKYNRLSNEYRESTAEANAPHAEAKLPTAASDAKPGPANALPAPSPAPGAPQPVDRF